MQTTVLCTLLVLNDMTNAHVPGIRFASALAHLLSVCHVFVVVGGQEACGVPSPPPAETCQCPGGAGAQVYRTAEAALTAQLASFRGAGHVTWPLAAWTGFVPFLPLYIHKLYI